MPARLPIPKTPKCYVGGAFIRSESARTFPFRHDDFLVHIPQCSRKDLRNAVEAAAKAGPGWQKRSGYNRGQILYRLAEMLESRHEEMAKALFAKSSSEASKEVSASVDRIVYYAGWADKYEHLLGSVNPVAAPYFNFTVSEPVGVCGVIAPDPAPLLGLISLVIPILASGNTVIALASESSPYPAILLGEMLATSDLPAGVLNILTGFRKEILPTMATHEHIRAIHAACQPEDQMVLQLGAAESVKRIHCVPSEATTDWAASSHQSLQILANFVEYKTVWHPIGN